MIWGFIDEYGELITPIKYSYAGDFNEGLALVEYNNESYYINKLGENLLRQLLLLNILLMHCT